jgi:hypothetical protein
MLVVVAKEKNLRKARTLLSPLNFGHHVTVSFILRIAIGSLEAAQIFAD